MRTERGCRQRLLDIFAYEKMPVTGLQHREGFDGKSGDEIYLRADKTAVSRVDGVAGAGSDSTTSARRSGDVVKRVMRVGLEYNYSSGDSNSKDGTHGTFDNLFPTNHKFYGYMDLLSWQNMHNLRATASIKPCPKLTVTADYHMFWLADTHDSFYNVSGAPRTGGGVGTGTGYAINSTYSSFVGSEIDLIATFAIKPFAMLQAGYGHFFVGKYVQQSLAAPAFGSHDADWLYSQVTFNF